MQSTQKGGYKWSNSHKARVYQTKTITANEKRLTFGSLKVVSDIRNTVSGFRGQPLL